MTDTALNGRLVHRIEGRVRIALDGALPDPDARERLVRSLGDLSQVSRVEIRPATGSLVLLHEGAFEAIAEAAADQGILTILPPKAAAPVDPIGDTMRRVSNADAAIARLSGGRGDLASVVFTALVIAGVVQLARGRLAGPALTLFGQAATLAMTRPFLGLRQ